MKNHTNNNLLYLVIAGFILLAVNAWVWMSVQNGQLSPVGNPLLWGAFMVLNMVSLLWAVGLLGLQPLVVACSYVVGGFLAYRGVQGMAGISVAEVTTAGATYGAIGALAVGNVGTKVRMAFFRKGQVPFIFVIAGLLVVDGVLNSQISGAGWNVVLNALVLPFALAGIAVGLVWVMISRTGISHKAHIKEMPDADGAPLALGSDGDDVAGGANRLVIQVPDDAVSIKDEPKKVGSMLATPEPVAKKAFVTEELRVERVAPVVEEIPKEESTEEHFFPLEIDKDDEFILPYEEAAPVAPDVLETELVPEVLSEPEPVPPPDVFLESAPAVEPTPEPEQILESEAKEEKNNSDWLSGHLDLMNKISNN